MDIKGNEDWMEYSISAWNAAGRPLGLEPKTILTDPIEYDKSFYKYFERRYIDMWLAIHSKVNPVNGTLLKNEKPAFRAAWKRNYSWPSIWKQTLPLLVYGTSLSVRNEILIKLASFYCIGQAIPSIVVDRILDENEKTVDADVAFCILAYIKSLKGIREMGAPCLSEINDTFVNLTGEMYERMLTEHEQRFGKIPEFMSEAISNYLLLDSRLLSSVFFGILPVWAHIMSHKASTKELVDSTEALRIVRQLNDEILDVNEDISEGLLTLPWLYAIEEKPSLRLEVEKLWEDPSNNKTLLKCHKILCESSGRKRAGEKSLEILSKSMKLTQELFPFNAAFDLTLLHNVRWACLNWLEKVDYNRDPNTIREPFEPQESILGSNHPIEPISGGGVIVFDKSQNVLLSLTLKRGMLRWELPAGVAKEGESLEETAQREALEETGKKIEIGEIAALCWHHSRKLNKGWMGIIYNGKLVDTSVTEELYIVLPSAFSHSKFNILVTPELYSLTNLDNCDFEVLNRLCEKQSENSPAHESVVASGFVDWTKIPVERIHPLHLKLLKSRKGIDSTVELLVSNADNDFDQYDENIKLYYKN